uniref:Hexosyltransferase n=1 Tax=Ditylenchus dipsaci TaxID=166011 RepID=A0A915DFX1_9BILA
MLCRRSFKPFTSRPVLLYALGFVFGLFLNSFIFHTSIRLLECEEKGLGDSNEDLEKPKDSLLLVGVMTASKYVDSRAWNVWRTWGQKIPGRLLFFVAEDTFSAHEKEMPLVHLQGVDDAAYPPQKKSFAMMRWMYDNQLNNFDWFMRADDDLYVRSDKLEKFLRSLDANKAHMIGQAGLGNNAEYGQLALGAKDNYCMGGPGVIFSREALRAVGPHLEKCLGELMTTHEDVELGRCVRKYVGIACTWNYEMQTLFHNNHTSNPNAAQNSPINDNFRKMITLHPVKDPAVMRQIHIRAQSIKLNQLREKKMSLARELHPSVTNELVRRISNTTEELRYWAYTSANKLSFCTNQVNCPRHTIDMNMKAAANQIVVKLFDQFNSNAQQRGRTLQFQNIQYGYSRVEPRHGVDYILDIVLWFKKFRPPNRATLSVRRHAYVQQTFGPIQYISDEQLRSQLRNGRNTDHTELINQANTKQVVYIVLALQGRADTFERFSNNLHTTLTAEDKWVKVVVVNYRSSNHTENLEIQKTLGRLSSFLAVQVVDMAYGNFSRGRALSAGAAAIADPHALLFFTDVDMLIEYESLERLFPIVFSEYSPEYWSEVEKESDKQTYANTRGYFRHFGFGLVSIYKQDFDQIGGFNQTIVGWGLEDVDLFEKCIHSPHLRVFRAPDPGLVHVAHPIQCRNDLPEAQKKMCIGTKAASLASFDHLADQTSLYL